MMTGYSNQKEGMRGQVQTLEEFHVLKNFLKEAIYGPKN
jgi:hypothetical protein